MGKKKYMNIIRLKHESLPLSFDIAGVNRDSYF